MSTTDPGPAAGNQPGLSVSHQTSPGGLNAAGALFDGWAMIAWRHNCSAPWEPLGDLPLSWDEVRRMLNEPRHDHDFRAELVGCWELLLWRPAAHGEQYPRHREVVA